VSCGQGGLPATAYCAEVRDRGLVSSDEEPRGGGDPVDGFRRTARSLLDLPLPGEPAGLRQAASELRTAAEKVAATPDDELMDAMVAMAAAYMTVQVACLQHALETGVAPPTQP
jgi:hypothetical protein